jgi:hypothetical protein
LSTPERPVAGAQRPQALTRIGVSQIVQMAVAAVTVTKGSGEVSVESLRPAGR